MVAQTRRARTCTPVGVRGFNETHTVTTNAVPAKYAKAEGSSVHAINRPIRIRPMHMTSKKTQAMKNPTVQSKVGKYAVKADTSTSHSAGIMMGERFW